MPGLRVVATGPFLSLQDTGRPGLTAIGVSRSGAADHGAYRAAVSALGHDDDPAVLEVLLGGLSVRAIGQVILSITGAPAPLVVDSVPVPSGVIVLANGSTLTLGEPATGLRTYVAARGGVEVPAVLGSRSWDTLAGLGPVPPQPGDVLPIGPPPALPVREAARPTPAPGHLTVHPGPRTNWFRDAPAALAGEWMVSSQSDRIGVRLLGDPLSRTAAAAGRELPSEPMVRGAVQVPPDGQPLVFLDDHPTTGGYPVIGVVDDAGCDVLAQARPGQSVHLRPAFA